jgi:hypothetical protein
MYRVRVFDELVYDTDTNLSNVLIGEDWSGAWISVGLSVPPRTFMTRRI